MKSILQNKINQLLGENDLIENEIEDLMDNNIRRIKNEKQISNQKMINTTLEKENKTKEDMKVDQNCKKGANIKEYIPINNSQNISSDNNKSNIENTEELSILKKDFENTKKTNFCLSNKFNYNFDEFSPESIFINNYNINLNISSSNKKRKNSNEKNGNNTIEEINPVKQEILKCLEFCSPFSLHQNNAMKINNKDEYYK